LEVTYNERAGFEGPEEDAMPESLMRWARERGYLVAWGPRAVVEAALDDVRSRERSGEVDAAFFAGNLAGFAAPGAGWDGLATAVVAAMPRPAHRVAFTVGGRRVEAVFPPTYVRYRALFEEVRRDLAEHALPGARVETLDVPLKPLAARLGLARYGRTNVTYVPPFGSYVQLFGYLTDAALPLPAGWLPREPELLDECEGCSACLAACPTAAIADDRVLLHAERCLTLVNENTGAWPAWLPASAHNCVIGCLLCQRVCPANPELPVEESGVAFDAEETAALLEGNEAGCRARVGLNAKIARLGQEHHRAMLGRNLRALVDSGRIGP
jgi:epoxyqueuosine reductase